MDQFSTYLLKGGDIDSRNAATGILDERFTPIRVFSVAYLIH